MKLVQIPSIYLVEKIRNRRAISVYILAVARLFWILIGLIPFLFSVKAGLVFLIIALAVVSQLMSLIFFRIWGQFSDRFSNKSVLRVSGPLFIGCILTWTFTTMPERYLLTIPLLLAIHILTGISAAGVNLASGNIGLKLAPRGQATAFLTVINLISSLAAAIGSIVGGKFADFFAERELSWTLRWVSPGKEIAFQTLNLQQWDFFFLLAFVIGLYSVHRLAMVKEVGEVEERVVFHSVVQCSQNVKAVCQKFY